MDSELDSGSSGPCSSPGWEHGVVFQGETLDSGTHSLSTKVYKWVPTNLMLWEPPNDNDNDNEFIQRIFYIHIFKCALQASDIWTKTRPQHRELRALLFTMSVWVL